MSRNQHPLPLPQIGTTMDASGLFGIERGDDGLLRAIGPQGRRANVGVSDAVAARLASFWQPDSAGLAVMLADGNENEALNKASQFPRIWDIMAPGEIENIFILNDPDVLTMCLPGIVAVRCLQDGMFHMIDDATDEASVIGLPAEAAIEIIRSWGGLNAAADLAGEYEGDGSVANILAKRWHVEAMARGFSS